MIFSSYVTAFQRSALVRRYHIHAPILNQNVGEHTYGVMCYVWLLSRMRGQTRPSAALLTAALFHDTAEYKTGDIPAPTKRGSLEIKRFFDNFEAKVLSDLGIEYPELTAAEEHMLKLADTLEGLVYCQREVKAGNHLMRDAFDNYKNYALSLKLTEEETSLLQYILEEHEQ